MKYPDLKNIVYMNRIWLQELEWMQVHWNRIRFIIFCWKWNQSLANKSIAKKLYHVPFFFISNQSSIPEREISVCLSSRLGYVIYLYLHILNTTFGNFSCSLFCHHSFTPFCTFQSTTLLAYMNTLDMYYKLLTSFFSYCYVQDIHPILRSI